MASYMENQVFSPLRRPALVTSIQLLKDSGDENEHTEFGFGGQGVIIQVHVRPSGHQSDGFRILPASTIGPLLLGSAVECDALFARPG